MGEDAEHMIDQMLGDDIMTESRSHKHRRMKTVWLERTSFDTDIEYVVTRTQNTALPAVGARVTQTDVELMLTEGYDVNVTMRALS